jgi:hypothetical protein
MVDPVQVSQFITPLSRGLAGDDALDNDDLDTPDLSSSAVSIGRPAGQLLERPFWLYVLICSAALVDRT